MSEFWVYFEEGFRYISYLHDYNLILYLAVLSIPYMFKDWLKLFNLISVLILGVVICLFLAIFGVVKIKLNLLSFLTAVTILSISFFMLLASRKSSKLTNVNSVGFVTLIFGILYGLSLTDNFIALAKGSFQSKILQLLEYSLGLALAILLVVFIILIFSYSVQTVFRFSKREWAITISAFAIGVVLTVIIKSEFWLR
jgi:hypothetical protein